MLRTTTLSQIPQEAEGVAALATQLDEDGVAFVPPPCEKREETLRRFLAARQGDVRKAAAFLKEDAAWRAAHALPGCRVPRARMLGVCRMVSACEPTEPQARRAR